MTDRTALLIDLSDAINELTRPRPHVEYVEQRVTVPIDSGKRRGKTKTNRVRRAHRTTMPPLLRQLQTASVPGAGDTTPGGAGFESRPAAELEPLSVLRDIQDQLGYWVRVFDLNGSEPLPKILSALVSAPHDPEQLDLIVMQAQRWVRDARVAVGLDAPPITLAQPCPYCWRKNALVITGDLQAARCTRCGLKWNPDTIGLLADMLRANEDRETMPAEPCWMPDCVQVGPHPTHQDWRGRTWGDVCAVPA